MENPPMFEERG